MSLIGNAKSGQKLTGRIRACDILTISAYGIAVKNGFVGTEEEWLASLNLDQEGMDEAIARYFTKNPVTVDETLSVSGKAADARATGDAINNLQKTNESVVNEHAKNKENPHGVTKAQVGLRDVDNTSDMSKPVSAAQAAAIADAKKAATDHAANTSNPHKVTKAQVGLGNVNNTSDANKPVSVAQAAAIADAKKAGTDAQATANSAMVVAADAAMHANTWAKNARPRNLLTNSDWRDKNLIINQRGSTTYSGSGYAHDRWVKAYGRPTVTINSTYITLKNDGSDSSYRLYQRLLKGTLKAGTKYTAVIKIHNGSVFSAVLEAPSSGDQSSSKLNNSFYLGIGKSDTLDTFYITVSSDTTINVDWVALYEGEYTSDNLPEYQSKDYGNELRECMLYFQTVKSAGTSYFTPIGFGWATSASVGRCAIPLSAPMRDGIVASKEKSTFTGMYLFDGSENAVSEITVVNSTSKVPTNVVVVDAAADVDNRAPCTLVVTGGELWLSKDL
jgi:hypothetical protein